MSQFHLLEYSTQLFWQQLEDWHYPMLDIPSYLYKRISISFLSKMPKNASNVTGHDEDITKC